MLAERVKEWTHEWEAKGIQKGRQEGEIRILLRLMRLKFSELDTETVTRVQSADTEQLSRWSERILSAKTVEEVFNIQR